jgi:tRNA uridine 5-carboxymethylaminomethyl modification enzyme
MFTSRAEYRILLRQDNADMRLTELSHTLGLARKDRYEHLVLKKQAVERLLSFFSETTFKSEEINPFLASLHSAPISQSKKFAEILVRPEISLCVPRETFSGTIILDFLHAAIAHIVPRGTTVTPEFIKEVLESVEITVKYNGYIEREKTMAEKMARLENVKIPRDFNFDKLSSVSIEGRQKLKRHQPDTIGQASRIPGVSPSDISVLLVYFGR